VRSGELRTPYRQRITAFCAREGIVVPAGFDRSKGCDRLLIDMTSEPMLVSRSTYLESSVIAFLDRAENAGAAFAYSTSSAAASYPAAEQGNFRAATHSTSRQPANGCPW